MDDVNTVDYVLRLKSAISLLDCKKIKEKSVSIKIFRSYHGDLELCGHYYWSSAD